MQNYVICECSPVADTVVCSPVLLRDYKLESLCIGPTGAFAIADSPTDLTLETMFGQLREFLGTARLGLYLRDTGTLLSSAGSTSLVLNESELQEVIVEHTQNGPFLLWRPEMLHRLSDKIRFEDARNRGIYRDNDGNWFYAYKGKFRPLSPKDPNEILRLALFGGILGFHRFALGKWFSGLLYLVTGGLMGAGWLMDLVQLHIGCTRDRKQRILPKPNRVSLLRYFTGFAINAALFCGYSVVSGLIYLLVLQTSTS